MLFLSACQTQERHFDCSSKNLSLVLFPNEPKSRERGPALEPNRIRQTSQKAAALMVRKVCIERKWALAGKTQQHGNLILCVGLVNATEVNIYSMILISWL